MPGSPNAVEALPVPKSPCGKRSPERRQRPAACVHWRRQNLRSMDGRIATRRCVARTNAPGKKSGRACCGSRRCAPWRPTPRARCRRRLPIVAAGRGASALRTGDTGSSGTRATGQKPSIGTGHHAGKSDAAAVSKTDARPFQISSTCRHRR
jgi:hypothetical protein